MIYMCSNGYMMVGDFIVVCINIGVWFVSKWFSCDFVDCGSLLLIINVIFSYKLIIFFFLCCVLMLVRIFFLGK